MGFSLDNLNPFTGFGLLDTGLEYLGSSELQEDAQAFDAELFDKSTAFAVEQFGRESDFTKEMQDRQYQYNLQAIKEAPSQLMAGLKAAGLNPILAATGGFKASPPSVQSGSAKANTISPGRGGAASGISSNVALAKRYGELIESEVDLNSAKAEAERARAGVSNRTEDILEPLSQFMQAVAGMLEQSNIDRETSQRVWRYLVSELPEKTEDLSPKEQAEMLDKAKKKFPQLKGVDNAKRKIFGGKK
jgi:hypothetical protein